MDGDTNKSLEALLRTGSLKTPPSDFTDKIMHRIDGESAKTTALEPELKKLIRLHRLKTPPFDLTRKIESQVFPKTQNHLPLISARTWYTVSLCILFLLAVGYYLFPSGTGSPEYRTIYWTSPLYKIPNLTSSIPGEYLSGLVTLFAILLVDFHLRYRTVHKRAKASAL